MRPWGSEALNSTPLPADELQRVRALADYWNFRRVASVKYPVQHTGISSHLGAKLRDWAARQAGAGCYSWAALSSNDSKTRYSSFCLSVVLVTTFNLFLASGDDALHFEPRQPQTHDEHAEGEVEKHPVWGLPRFQGEQGIILFNYHLLHTLTYIIYFIPLHTYIRPFELHLKLILV